MLSTRLALRGHWKHRARRGGLSCLHPLAGCEYRVEAKEWIIAPDKDATRSILLVSAICFLRECLVDILKRVEGFRISGQAATLECALDFAHSAHPDIILFDATFQGGIQTGIQIREAAPNAILIVLGVLETEADVLFWAQAGIGGYIPNTASVNDLISMIDQISRGEQICSPHIAASLLRRISSTRRALLPTVISPEPLTPRELEILRLVADGLSNKAIARRLSVSLGTTKSHVHNILGKLKLQRRAEVITRIGVHMR